MCSGVYPESLGNKIIDRDAREGCLSDIFAVSDISNHLRRLVLICNNVPKKLLEQLIG